jgi:hypothetical protein
MVFLTYFGIIVIRNRSQLQTLFNAMANPYGFGHVQEIGKKNCANG